VDDLKKEDFKIFDNGQPQQIATFSLESAKVAEEKLQKAPPLPQNTFTNRVELRPKPPNGVTVMLLDGSTDASSILRVLGRCSPLSRRWRPSPTM
jgi:hypothetical protein